MLGPHCPFYSIVTVASQSLGVAMEIAVRGRKGANGVQSRDAAACCQVGRDSFPQTRRPVALAADPNHTCDKSVAARTNLLKTPFG
jgi:hypothetical protein